MLAQLIGAAVGLGLHGLFAHKTAAVVPQDAIESSGSEAAERELLAE